MAIYIVGGDHRICSYSGKILLGGGNHRFVLLVGLVHLVVTLIYLVGIGFVVPVAKVLFVEVIVHLVLAIIERVGLGFVILVAIFHLVVEIFEKVRMGLVVLVVLVCLVVAIIEKVVLGFVILVAIVFSAALAAATPPAA